MLDSNQISTIEELRKDKKFSRVFDAMNEKYRKTGKYSGRVYIENLSEEEKIFFSSIDIKIMEQNFAEFTIGSFFKKKVFTGLLSGLEMHEFWDIYNKNKIRTKYEIREEAESQKKKFFESLLFEYQGTQGGEFLKRIISEKDYGYSIVMREYKKNKIDLNILLRNVLNALNSCPLEKPTEMPIFSTQITQNPHYFDYGETAFKLFIHGLSFISGEKYPASVEEIQELLSKFGLAKDSISNQITVFNISVIKNNSLHMGVEYFNQSKEPISLTLKNINGYTKILPKNKILYIFENPSVFSAVADRVGGLEVSLLCTSGNLNLSALSFLDKISENCSRIYYSGDFDPEGIRIADYLYNRYSGKLILWRMSAKDYHKAMSNVDLDEKRLAKLKSIKSSELADLADLISNKKLAGYQEVLIESYIDDILENTRPKFYTNSL